MKRIPALFETASVVLACLALSAFVSCSSGIAQVGSDGISASRVFAIGAVLSSVFAIAAGIWVARRAGRTIPRWLRGLYAAGWILASILCFAASMRLQWEYGEEAVRVPFRWDIRHAQPVSFRAKKTAKYNLQIELKRRIPDDNLDALMGVDWRSQELPKVKRPTVSWKVDAVSEADQDHHWRSAWWGGDSVGLSLGGFQAVKGRIYDITASVLKPTPELQITDPQLIVQLNIVHRDEYFAVGILLLFAGIIGLVIGLMLSAAVGLSWLRERMTISRST